MDSNYAFEERIEEYKKANYRLVKRDGNSVEMLKQIEVSKSKQIILLIVIIVCAIFLPLWTKLIMLASAVICCFGFIYSFNITNKVIISINTIGQIEETGKVLEKK